MLRYILESSLTKTGRRSFARNVKFQVVTDSTILYAVNCTTDASNALVQDIKEKLFRGKGRLNGDHYKQPFMQIIWKLREKNV